MSDDKKRDTSRDIAIAHELPVANERPVVKDNAVSSGRRIVEADKNIRCTKDGVPPPKPRK